MRIGWLAKANMASDNNKENYELIASKLTKQISHLDCVSLDRYSEKLIFDQFVIPDPYGTGLKFESSTQKWPDVSYGDIYNYLINTPGIYTHESMKAFKSLEGYNFYECGHVQEVLYAEVSKEIPVCVLKSKIMPSQRVTDKPHETWVCVHKTKSYIHSAHCTCKAGLGEACSHIAALLFKVERAVLYGFNKESRTSVTCAWNQFYQKKVTPQPIEEIDFSRPKRKQVKKRKKPTVTVDEEPDETDLFKKLRQIHPSACVLLKDDSKTDSASEDEELPPLLHRCWNLESDIPGNDRDARFRHLMSDFTATNVQTRNLEMMTREQHQSPIWHRQRQGRITALFVHDIKTLKKDTPRTSLVNKILKINQRDLKNVDAVKYGIERESVAKRQYEAKMSSVHENFSLRESGLVVDTTCAFFAATPDGVRECSCHGAGLLEVKCSFKHRESEITDITDSTFYLEKESLYLRRNHRYFTQIQFQMYVCNKTFCDFVVFTEKGVHIQTIDYDADFVNGLIKKCYSFVTDDLLPEIVQRKLM